MTLPDPENDPAILALERDEAYATARHHQELREEAEAHERLVLSKMRKLKPKAYAYTAITYFVAQYQTGQEGMTAQDLISKIARRIREANDELKQISGDCDDDVDIIF